MLGSTGLTSTRQFKIRDFKEDKSATLEANPGLRYEGKNEKVRVFSGNFFLRNPNGDLIESFGVRILLPNTYPNAFPVLFSTDQMIPRSDDYHISKKGVICVEHNYIANVIAGAGLRLYDFIEFYLPRYFSWVLLKQNGLVEGLQEWAHEDKGTIQVYEELLGTINSETIQLFLENYLAASEIKRNDRCYCGSDKKLKYCHFQAALFLKSTPKSVIEKDIDLFY